MKVGLNLVRKCYTAANFALINQLFHSNHVEKFRISKVDFFFFISLHIYFRNIKVNYYVILSRQQVFGLGNKTYEHYNKVAIYVDKRLEELGATRVYELGLGDDDAKYVNKKIISYQHYNNK
jgi:hypothetical protein